METQQYNWNWSEDHCSVNKQLPGDQLDRAKYAKFLTNYLSRFSGKPYVMNLNAEWGAGKTWFLQRWYQTVKEHHPAAYIDAWNSDFSDDPLLTVASGLLEALEHSLPSNAAAEKYRALSLRKLGLFIKGAVKNAALHQANKHLGEDAVGLVQSGLAEVTETVVSSVIKDHRRKLSVINELKEAMEHWISLITDNSNLRKPMFVFIDELDRCRPTYAIELLETVKHLFDVKGLVFVIATNTDQLQHSIKAVYGSEFDAQRYLYRFFNRSFMLKKPDLLSFIHAQPVFIESLSKVLLRTCDGRVIIDDIEALAENLAAICESFAFDLRTTLQWMDQLAACYADEKNINKYFWLATAILLAMKISSPDIFEKFTTRYNGFHFQKRPDIREFDHQLLERPPGTNKKVQFKMEPVNLHGSYVRSKSGTTTIFRDSLLNQSYGGSGSGNRILQEIHEGFSLRSPEDEDVYKGGLAQAAYDGRAQLLKVAIHYCEKQHKVDYQGYIDMVELASDLS